jgi:Domain of unknown function (DUF4158)
MQFLLDRAMEHDSPTLLFNLAREYLMSAKVIRPGAVTLAKMVGTARAGAGELTSQQVEHLLTLQVRQDLDLVLMFDAGLGMTRLAWLTTAAVEATASAVKTSIEKLVWLRNMDAHRLDLSVLPNERRRFLAMVGRRSTVQALERRGERRYPILLALVAQSAVDQLDEVVALFDRPCPRGSRGRSPRPTRRWWSPWAVPAGAVLVPAADVCSAVVPRQCAAAFAIAEARSAGRLHIGQCPVGRSTSSRSRRVATSAIIGCPWRAICMIVSEEYEQAMIVDGTSRRESFLRCSGSRVTGPGSGTARARNRSRSSSLRPSRLARSCSNGGSGTSSASGGTEASKAEPSPDGPLST